MFFDVLDAVWLHNGPLDITSAKVRKANAPLHRTRAWAHLSAASRNMVLECDVQHGRPLCVVSARAWLQSLGLCEMAVSDVLLTAPDPLLSLVLHKQWDVFALSISRDIVSQPTVRIGSGFHVLLAGLELKHTTKRMRGSGVGVSSSDGGTGEPGCSGDSGPPVERDLNAEVAQCMQFVRKWHRDSGIDSIEAESCLQVLQRVAEMAAPRFSLGIKQHMRNTRTDAYAYSATGLLRAWLLTGVAKSEQTLTQTILRVAELILPHEQVVSIKSAFARKVLSVPSSSTLSRNRMRIDVAFMLYMRSMLSSRDSQDGPCLRYILYDSSPSHHDWEMEWHDIRRSDVQE